MNRRGLTLVELLISLALTGVLAAVAAPAWEDAKLRAERAELPSHLDGIAQAEQAHHLATGHWVPAERFAPDARPGRKAREWAASGGFQDLGWAPEGPVRGSYAVYVRASGFEAHGVSDVDGDGAWSWWRSNGQGPAETLSAADEY